LWLSDGSAANTQWVQDLLVGSGSSEPRELTAVGASGRLMFSADVGMATGRQLWLLDTSQVPTEFGVSTISLSAASTSLAEGNSGNRPITFTVTRTGDTRETSRVYFAVPGNGVSSADAA